VRRSRNRVVNPRDQLIDDLCKALVVILWLDVAVGSTVSEIGNVDLPTRLQSIVE
jgi:hypothetical protein